MNSVTLILSRHQGGQCPCHSPQPRPWDLSGRCVLSLSFSTRIWAEFVRKLLTSTQTSNPTSWTQSMLGLCLLFKRNSERSI